MSQLITTSMKLLEGNDIAEYYLTLVSEVFGAPSTHTRIPACGGRTARMVAFSSTKQVRMLLDYWFRQSSHVP